MITWNDKKFIIFSLENCLLQQNIQLMPKIEQLLFGLNELKATLSQDFYLVSNQDPHLLEATTKKFGFKFFFNYVNSSKSLSSDTSDERFWQKYFEKLEITPKATVLFSNKPSEIKHALSEGVDTVVMLQTQSSNLDELAEDKELVKYKDNILILNDYSYLLPMLSEENILEPVID